MGFWDVTTKQVLKKLGGDIIRSKVLTWDGDTSNQVMFGATPAVKIYDKFVKFDNIAGVTLTSDQHDVFIPKKDFLAHQVAETLGFAQAVIQIEEGYSFVYFAIPADLPDEAIEQLGDLEEGVYYGLTSETKQISKLHFAETIVPIDPKYLPGACLPVVELETVIEDGAVLTDAEKAMLTSYVEQRTPILIRFRYNDNTITSPAALSVFDTGAGFLVSFGIQAIQFAIENGDWVVFIM